MPPSDEYDMNISFLLQKIEKLMNNGLANMEKTHDFDNLYTAIPKDVLNT